MCAGGGEAGPAGPGVVKRGASCWTSVEGCRARTQSPPRIHKLGKTSLCRPDVGGEKERDSQRRRKRANHGSSALTFLNGLLGCGCEAPFQEV